MVTIINNCINGLCAYIAKQLTTHSLQEIGLQLGNKDHTTVIYSVKKVEERISSDPGFANVISKMESVLKNGLYSVLII